MNETECENLINSVKWTEPTSLISLAILEFINVLVIGGNLLVIIAVFCSNKLRSVTNFFIVNLAVADLLVGIAVLPFSATWEVFKVWIFGDVWCRIWLAVDVWMCTASILNLCAISLDRYVAVTRPVTYPSIMSTKKAKSLIAGIWVLSFVICFPPLVGWKDQKPFSEAPSSYIRGNDTLYYVTTISTTTTTTTTSAAAAARATVTAGTATVTATSTSTIGGRTSTTAAPLMRRVRPLSPLPPQTANEPLLHVERHSLLGGVGGGAGTHKPHNKQKNNNRNNHHTMMSSTIPTVTATLAGSFDPYNPYNPEFAPLEDDFNVDEHFSSIYPPADDGDGDDDDDSPQSTQKPMMTRQAASHLADYNGDDDGGGGDDGAAVPNLAVTNNNNNNNDNAVTSRPQTPPKACPWKCELTNDRGYVLYSALGSFYIPMFVMLFFYWRIYRAAVRTTRAINQGFKTTKGSKGIGSRFEEQRLTLRIHRGRGSNPHDSMHSNGSTHSTTTTLGTPSPERLSKYATRRSHHHDKIKISVSYPSSENINELSIDETHEQPQRNSTSSGSALFAVHYSGTNGRDTTESQLYRGHGGGGGGGGNNSSLAGNNCYLQVGKSMPEMSRRHSNTSVASGHHHHHHQQQQQHQLNRPTNKKMGKRNIKAQVKRFRMETKAAKTLAIIVGLFILCWLPFFTIYIIRPFCEDCIDPLLFSILFWLGYCNSAVNPMIYALFSKDFRFAFKRIICRCFCNRQSVSLKSSRRGSDMSAIRIRARTPSITPSAAAHSFGDESEMHHSEMGNNMDPR